MASYLDGPTSWSMQRDEEGHRDYTITFLVRTDDPDDGPAVILNTPGLPVIGSPWVFGNDVDLWAFCTPEAKIEPVKRKEKGYWWAVEMRFTTRPLRLCKDDTIEDPLLMPPKVSGSFVKYTKEVVKDRYGEFIKSSSHEMFRGPQVEFDHNRPTVRIEQNVANLQLGLVSSMVDKVNDSPLWGLSPRCIKLSNVSWERNYYGSCYVYYTRTLDFDIDYNTFDREILDEGTKVLNGHWDYATGAWVIDPVSSAAGTGPNPDPDNPSHFIRYKDRHGENARVILNGRGLPAETDVRESGTAVTTSSGGPGIIRVEYYDEVDFLLLGIPTSL